MVSCSQIVINTNNMCLNIYIGSAKQLPTIPWDDENPGFCIDELVDLHLIEMLTPILQSNYYYDIGSHMGCCCGFSFGENTQADPNEHHEQRVKDVTDLLSYLSAHLRENTLKLFCTLFHEFPPVYPEIVLSVSEPLTDEFYFEEDVIVLVQK